MSRYQLLFFTLKRLTNKEIENKIWQRNYYEHIIRNEREYYEIIKYMQNNPIRWIVRSWLASATLFATQAVESIILIFKCCIVNINHK